MLTNTLKRALIFCGMFAFVATANAMPIVFNFVGGGANGTSIAFVDAATGVAIDVRARNTTDNAQATVTWNNSGLGVRSDDDAGGGSGQLDSFGDNERLNFVITDLNGFGALELVSITFANLDIDGPNMDDFGVRFDGTNPFVGGANFTPSSNPWIAALDLNEQMRMFSDRFSILLNGNDAVADSFRIASITFNAVPEPATFLLVMLGLVGSLLFRRSC